MSFNIKQVDEVSNFLQSFMKKNKVNILSADEAAQLLADNNILPNDVGPKPAFNFRQMLRDGRHKIIPLVKGAFQERPKTRWTIYLVASAISTGTNFNSITSNKNKRTKIKGKPKIVESEKEMDNPIYGLEPIINDKTKILILGTFPAKESIEKNFYYQNQIKRFWGQALSYIASLEKLLNNDRKKILLEKGIGLWDIFECVEREKSNQDKAIRKAKYNDINLFLKQHPSVEYLVFNGGNAFQWLREDKSGVFERENLDTKKLQSSSGRNGHFNQGKDWEEYFKIIYKLIIQ